MIAFDQHIGLRFAYELRRDFNSKMQPIASKSEMLAPKCSK
jgi:hypothetical protein